MEEILTRVQEAPGLFLANIKTHLADGPMDSGDKAAWWLLHELQAVLFYRNSIVELERLQQTTLQSLNITLVSNATR